MSRQIDRRGFIAGAALSVGPRLLLHQGAVRVYLALALGKRPSQSLLPNADLGGLGTRQRA